MMKRKTLFITLYLVIASAFLWSLRSVKFFKVGSENCGIFWLCVIFAIIMPAGMIFWFFRKTTNKGDILKLIVSIPVLLCAAGSVIFFMLGGGICSATTDIADYGELNEMVKRQVESGNYPFPTKVPQQASDIEYSYFYRQTLDDEVKMTLAYTLEEEEFEKERRRIEGTYHIVLEEKIENTDLYFTAVSERVIFVGFDEDRHRVLYGYLANMGQKISADYYGMMM